MVGSGTDTYDPTCDLAPGHAGACMSFDAVDQNRLERPAEFVQTLVTVVVIHRAGDREKVRNAFEDWNVTAGVDAIYNQPTFHERPVNIGEPTHAA